MFTNLHFLLFLPNQYLTKQNLALKEVNDSRMQIYESLDVSIRDLEIEKHGYMVQSSNDKKLIKRLVASASNLILILILIKFSISLKQSNETLELSKEELTKQIEELTRNMELERRKSDRLRESSESQAPLKSIVSKVRHTSSASEPETEEVRSNSLPTASSANFLSFQLAGFHTYKSAQVIHQLRTELVGAASVHELLARLLQHPADLLARFALA